MIILTLANNSDTVALMTRIKVTEQDKMIRILPVFYSDNCISLVPGETTTITVKGIPENEKARVFIDGWNTKPLEIEVQ